MTNILLPLNVNQHGGNLSFLWMAQVGECLAPSLLHALDMMWSQRIDTAEPDAVVPKESAELGSRGTWFCSQHDHSLVTLFLLSRNSDSTKEGNFFF